MQRTLIVLFFENKLEHFLHLVSSEVCIS